MLRSPGAIRADPLGGGRVCAALTALTVLTVLLLSQPALATVLPADFQETVVLEIAFPANLSQFAFAPDGRVFLADKFGRVTVYAPAAPEDYVLESSLQLDVDATGERGINGLAVDPGFAVNGQVWIFYTTPGTARNRVSRFRYTGGSLGGETVMLEGPLLQGAIHNGGCLRFASDGTLFVSTGDDGQGSLVAEDPFDLRGKILRINRDGSPASDNPFADGSAGDARVWALGFRNPYRISIQPGSDNVFIADVGSAAWEELSLGIAGADFGWSEVEGPEPPAAPGKVYPIFAFAHASGQGSAIIGGDHAPTEFGPGFAGDYFYADFVQRTLWRLGLDVTNTPTESEVFATDFGPATDLQFGPDGALYYACRSCSPASLRRIGHVAGANAQPVAHATASVDSGAAPLDVTLMGVGSIDPDDDPLTYDWDLGDGGHSADATPTRTYAAGVYHVSLTVRDGQGGEDTAAPLRIVAGNSRPQVVVNTPPDESTYSAGQIVPYSGAVTDGEEGQVPCAATTWQVFRHHGSHSHPVRGPVQGQCVGVFQVPVAGEARPDQWYEIRMTARDTGEPLGPGAILTGASSIQIRPNLSTLTFESTPVPGLEVQLDETPLTTPATVQSLVNASRTLGTATPQPGPDGLWYRFQGWSDGGAREHPISTPAGPTTYTADFACVAPEISSLMINPGTSGQIDLTWDAADEGCLKPGPGRYRIYAATDYRPEAGGGSFPTDPMFRLLATSESPQLSLAASPRDVFFLVVGAGPDDLDGRVGHYGF